MWLNIFEIKENIMGKPIPTIDRDPLERLDELVQESSSAQIQLWHAQSQRDHGMISDKELAIVEKLAGQVAGQSRSIYNPYTGELRKVFLPDWYTKHRPEDPTLSGWTPPQPKKKLITDV